MSLLRGAQNGGRTKINGWLEADRTLQALREISAAWAACLESVGNLVESDRYEGF